MTVPPQQQPRPAKDWENYFRHAGVLVEKLETTKSSRSKSTSIGSFLARNVGRKVTIEHEGRPVQAQLRAYDGRSNQKLYAFEVALETEGPSPKHHLGTIDEAATLSAESTPGGDRAAGAQMVEPATGASHNLAGDDQGGDPRRNDEVW